MKLVYILIHTFCSKQIGHHGSCYQIVKWILSNFKSNLEKHILSTWNVLAKLRTKTDLTYKTGLQFWIHLRKWGLSENITFQIPVHHTRFNKSLSIIQTNLIWPKAWVNMHGISITILSLHWANSAIRSNSM